MRVVIIEDEPLAAQRLQLLLKELDCTIVVEIVLDSVEDSVKYFNNHAQPDLVLLDIELADGLSFRIFSKLSLQCPVIFTTAYDRYAVEAFSLFSIDYLLKPVSLESLARAINKYKSISGIRILNEQILEMISALKKPNPEYKSRFLVKVGNRMIFVEAMEVAYFFADDKVVYMVTKDGSRVIIDYSLEKLQDMLDPKAFFRLNRSIICNISSIREVKNYMNSRLKIAIQAGVKTDAAIVSRERVNAFKVWAET
jgi:two-component system response regulator LytT